MRKLIIVAIVALALSGCGSKMADLAIKEIDGCQYVVASKALSFLANGSVSVIHHGNCKNPIHRGGSK